MKTNDNSDPSTITFGELKPGEVFKLPPSFSITTPFMKTEKINNLNLVYLHNGTKGYLSDDQKVILYGNATLWLGKPA